MSKNLEDLDIKDAQERTRIEPEFFQALLNKDFEELQKFNVKGFFKILNRANSQALHESFLSANLYCFEPQDRTRGYN